MKTRERKFKRKRKQNISILILSLSLAWQCTGLVISDFSDSHWNKGTATPPCKNKGTRQILESKVEAEIESKVESEFECDGIRN